MASPSFLLIFILLAFLPGGAPDLAGDAAALLAFRAAVGSFVLKWNATASPCSWRGVSCSGGRSSRVTALRLPGVGLIGEIPAGTFTNLTELDTLSLRLNALSGSLSPDIATMKNLRGLFLNGNRFSGELPNALFSLPVLSRLDLSTNQFSGEISPAINNLTSLKALLLENNNFSGKIPDINLRRHVLFNVSYNNFTGSVPRGLSSAPATAFLGMSLCGAPLKPCATPPSPSPSPSPSTSPSTSPSPFSSPSPVPATPTGNHKISDKGAKQSSKLSGGAIAGIAVGSAAGLLILIAIFIVLCRKRGGERQPRSVAAAGAAAASANGAGAEKAGRRLVFTGGSPEFELEDLLRASAEVLGKGTYGTAYKAVLDGGLTVAVKRLRDVNLEEREFRGRILAVGSVNHRNVLQLMAYYYSKDEKLVVYEYLPEGSLSSLLHGNRGSGLNTLDWRKRCRIALAAARGIEYIHSTSSTAIHGNIKSSNILLHKQDDARVADYGIAQLVSQNTINHTAGYRAPEVTDARKVSQMADVYSFGVLVLELLTGKAPAQMVQNAEGLDLPRWVRSVTPEEWKAELFDLELLRQQNTEECMVQLLHLALECTAQYPADRPSMSEIVVGIERIYNLSLESSSSGQIHDDSYSSRRTESIDESRF